MNVNWKHVSMWVLLILGVLGLLTAGVFAIYQMTLDPSLIPCMSMAPC